jgi:hypothetical protein
MPLRCVCLEVCRAERCPKAVPLLNWTHCAQLGGGCVAARPRKAKFGCNLKSTSAVVRRIIHGRCASSLNNLPSYSFRKLIPNIGVSYAPTAHAKNEYACADFQGWRWSPNE